MAQNADSVPTEAHPADIVSRTVTLSKGCEVRVWFNRATGQPTVMGAYKPSTVANECGTYNVQKAVWHHNFITGESYEMTPEGTALLRDAIVQLVTQIDSSGS